MHERLVEPSNGGVGRGHERRGDDRSTHQIATQQLKICDELFDREKFIPRAWPAPILRLSLVCRKRWALRGHLGDGS
jgi:hypothetical protein